VSKLINKPNEDMLWDNLGMKVACDLWDQVYGRLRGHLGNLLYTKTCNQLELRLTEVFDE